VHFLQKARSPARGLQKEDQFKPAMPGPQWQTFLAQGQHDRHWFTNPGSPGAGFSVLSLMEPLLQAPAIIPQLIMNLCAVSIVTYNKLSEIMTPFHGGNKIRP
jgi:hypothetical protein